MDTSPALLPLPPTTGRAVPLSTSPFWIGSASGCTLRLHLPGIAGRHASIMEREDGFWLAAGPGAGPAPTVNGSAVQSELRLSHGDVIELAPAARYRFESGEQPESFEEEPAAPVFAEAPAPRKRRRRRGLTRAQRRRLRFAGLTGVAIVVVLGLVAVAVVMLLRAL